jgi:hypothetical protein
LNGAGWLLLAAAWREVQRQAEILFHLTKHEWCRKLYDSPRSPWVEAGDELERLALHDLRGLTALAAVIVRPGTTLDGLTEQRRPVTPEDEDMDAAGWLDDSVLLATIGLPSDFDAELQHA